MKPKPLSILAVDDDRTFLASLPQLLGTEFALSFASGAEEAERLLETKDHGFELVLLDFHLGNVAGSDLLKAWRARFPELPIVIFSAESDVRVATKCLRQGAQDYILKGSSTDDIRFIVHRVLEKRALEKKIERLGPLMSSRAVQFLGKSQAVQDVLEKVRKLKGHTHLNILILGESGTGKEVLARALYQEEGNPDRPFIVANMPAIPATLMEAELFGVEKGAFTDAKVSRPGKFEMADGGDIFLDEIGDLPLEMQAKILRTLQEKQFQRVGDSKIRTSHFRAIAATNQPLADLLSHGKFREDLIYRLSDVVLWLAPLRERKEDILELALHFIQKHCRLSETPSLSDSAREQLLNYSWPGNVRQLESTIKRALVFSSGKIIDSLELIDPLQLVNKNSGFIVDKNYCEEMKSAERNLLSQALAKSGGDKARAIEALKLPRATFYRKLAEHGL